MVRSHASECFVTAPKAISSQGEVLEQFGNMTLRVDAPEFPVDDGWSGYWSVLRAHWMLRGNAQDLGPVTNVTADVRDQMVELLGQMKCKEVRKGRQIRSVRSYGRTSRTRAFPRSLPTHTSQIHPDGVRISWWHEDKDGRLAYGEEGNPFPISHGRVEK